LTPLFYDYRAKRKPTYQVPRTSASGICQPSLRHGRFSNVRSDFCTFYAVPAHDFPSIVNFCPRNTSYCIRFTWAVLAILHVRTFRSGLEVTARARTEHGQESPHNDGACEKHLPIFSSSSTFRGVY